MTVDTLRIHIGGPKTGSTAIQRALYGARDALRTHGIVYPDTRLRGWGHHDLCIELADTPPDWATPPPHGLDGMGQCLEATVPDGTHMVLLSTENFYLFPEPQRLVDWFIRHLGRPRRVVVDLFVRRQAEVLESWYNQLVKAQGFAGSFEDAVVRDGHLWDWNTRIGPWVDVFGESAIRVHAYHPVRGQVVSAYGEHLGLPAGVLVEPTTRTNSRLVRDALEFQRQLNTLPVPVPQRRRFHRALTALSGQAETVGLLDTPFVSADRLMELEARYHAGNRTLAERFCGGELPVEHAPLDPRAPDDYPGLRPDIMARLFGWLLLTQPPT